MVVFIVRGGMGKGTKTGGALLEDAGPILLSEASFAPRAGCVTGCAVICVWFKFTQLSIDSTNTNPA